MKVYFTASARGKKNYLGNYQKIHGVVEKLGHKHLDNLLFDINLDEFYSGNDETQKDLYKNTLSKIKKADLVILEISVQSLSMGYIIDRSLKENVPVILLYEEKSNVNPYFIGGMEDDRLQVVDYNLNNIEKQLRIAIEDAKNEMDVRFNFFVSPKIVRYLDFVSKEKRIPRAVYLRRLIEKDMRQDKQYLKKK